MIDFLRDGFMPFTFTLRSTHTFTMAAGETLTPPHMVQPAWDQTSE
ncbi:hypothetical protein JCM14469_16380 [Desulfatiferula olefinivorans]